jgi:hypothetical protein
MSFFLRRKHIQRGILLAVLGLIVVAVSPVMADYLGPDRSVTTTDVEYYDYGVWAQQFDLSQCPDSQYGVACIVCSWEDDPFTASCAYDYEYGYPNFYWIKIGTQARTVIHTTTYPEATVNGTLQNCTLQNGWCVTTPSLEIAGSEPLYTLLGPQYYIMAIEGTRNGQTFACSGSTCNVSLVEGANSFEFWAISTWGDTSQMGTLTANVDTQPPGIIGQVSGTTGDNGWYVTPAEVSASASDATSGVAAFEYSLDGGTPTPYTDPLSLPDGNHTIVFQAVDVAGFTASVSQTVNVDTQPPQIDLTNASNFCPGCGQPLDIDISVDDAGSGIAAWRLVADGATVLVEGTASASQIFSWNGNAFQAGTHALVLEARDVAGNVSQVGIDVALLLPPESPVDDSPVAPAIRQAGPIPPLSTQPSVPTRPAVQVFGSNPPTQVVNNRPPDDGVTIAENETPVPADSSSPNVLWGVAAAGLIGAATAIAVDQWRKRKQSEVDQQVDAAVQAAAFNAQQHPRGLEQEIPREDQTGKDDGAGGSKDKSGPGKKGALPASSDALKNKSTTSNIGKEPVASWLQRGTNWLQTHVLTPAGNWINQHIPIAQPATKTGKCDGQRTIVDKKGNSPLKTVAVVGSTLFGMGAAGYLAWPWLEDAICGPGAKLNPFSGLTLGVLPVVALAMSSKGMRIRSSVLGLLAMLMILSACGPAPTTSLAPNTTATTEWPCTPTATLVPDVTSNWNVTITGEPSDSWTQSAGIVTIEDLASNYTGLAHLDGWIQANNTWLINNGYSTSLYYWQNYPNQFIFDAATNYQLPPLFLKGICMTESNCALTPTIVDPNTGQPQYNLQAGGIMQITPLAGDTVFGQIPNHSSAQFYYSTIYNYASQNGMGLTMLDFPIQPYFLLSDPAKRNVQYATQLIYDGQCTDNEALVCAPGGTPILENMPDNINLASLALLGTENYYIRLLGEPSWNAIDDNDKLMLLAAGYFTGMVDTGYAINAAGTSGNQTITWDTVRPYLEELDPDCAANASHPQDCVTNYVMTMVCYASQMSEQPGNPCRP